MFKHHLNYFLLTEFIFAESVQISFSCNYCICLLFLCVLADSSEKYNECVHVKKSCFFSFQFFFCAEISHFLHTCEKLKQDQIVMKKKKEYLILCLFKFQLKSLHLQHHQ